MRRIRDNAKGTNRYVYARTKKSNKQKYLALAFMGACVVAYLGLATSAGDYISKNVISPLMQSVGGGDTTVSSDKIVQTLNINGYKAYAIQLGAYDSEESAKLEADASVKRGAAGYIVKDGSSRVLAASYTTAADAQMVKDQLLSQSQLESSIYEINVAELDLKITSDKLSFDKINGAFETFNTAKDALGQLSLRLDKREFDAQKGKEELEIIKTNLQAGYDSIKDIKENVVVKGFIEIYKSALDNINGISESDVIILSSKVKNAYISMIYNYSNFTKTLTNS